VLRPEAFGTVVGVPVTFDVGSAMNAGKRFNSTSERHRSAAAL